MNRYPRWKYITILVILLLGVVYSIPNFFGEVPAVQVSPATSVAQVDQALLTRVESTLKDGSIPYDGVIFDSNGIKVRVRDNDTQLKAKDALQASLGSSYTVALNLLSATPNWLQSVGALPMYLGLDLRGGVHFLMQVDMKAALNKQLDRQTNDIRNKLRDEKIPLAGVSRDGTTLIVKFKDADTRDLGLEALRKTLRDVTVTSLDDGRLQLVQTPVALKAIQDQAIQQNMLTLHNRVNELGVAEPVIQQQGADRVVVNCPACRTPPRPRTSWAVPPAWKSIWWTTSIWTARPWPPPPAAWCPPAMTITLRTATASRCWLRS